MSYYVYILQCNDGSYYVGSTSNIKNRLSSHSNGLVATTKIRRPVTLKWYCCFVYKKKAVQLERYLKKGSGFAFSRKRLL